MSEANRVSLKYIPEVTYGTTPTDSSGWQALRYVSQSIAAAPQTVISNEIRSDRMVSDLVLVGNQVGGDMTMELSMTTYDELLEAAMMGTWTTDVLKAGIVERSFSVEAGFEDWSPAHYLQYKGMRVGGFNLSFPYGAIVTGGFQMVGKEALESATSLVGAGSTTAATTTDVVNGSSDVTAIQIDGGAPGVIIKTINLTLNNSMRPIEGIGSVGPSDQSAGRSLITGSLECYFDNITMYQALLNNTDIALNWTVGDGSNTQTYLLPKIKFNSGVPAVTGVDTDVMLPLEFTALYDSVEGTNLKITRVVA